MPDKQTAEERVKRLQLRMRMEVVAMCIVGEWGSITPSYTHETKRTYWFTKNGCKIGIPKKLLNERILTLAKGNQ